MFLETCLPSLLSPGNLPALANLVFTRIVLYCPSADIERMKAMPAIGALRAVAQLEFVAIDRHDLSDHLSAHAEIWHREMDRVAGEDMVITVPPDSVLSDGSLGLLGQLINQGKRCFYVPETLTVAEDTFLSAVRAHTSGSAITIPARELVALALRHLHPFTAAQAKDTP